MEEMDVLKTVRSSVHMGVLGRGLTRSAFTRVESVEPQMLGVSNQQIISERQSLQSRRQKLNAQFESSVLQHLQTMGSSK